SIAEPTSSCGAGPASWSWPWCCWAPSGSCASEAATCKTRGNMPLAVDSLVTDLIFKANAQVEQETLLDALGGLAKNPDITQLDVDGLDPRMEMELSPSMPFRRRGERRLLIIDGSVAPMRQSPDDPIVAVDLRAAKDQLVTMCEKLPIRLGRLF